MVEESVTVRPYQPGDEEVINALFNRIFKKSRTRKEWERKFLDNPAGRDITKWVTVMEAGDRIFGHCACMPVEMKYGNTVKVAGQVVDIMIDPLSRDNMHFFKLGSAGIDAIQRRVSFTFGFPNETAHQIGKRFMGYQDLGEMVQFFKRLSLRSAVKRRFKWFPGWLVNVVHTLSKLCYMLHVIVSRSGKDVYVREAERFDERIDKFWNKVKDKYEIMAIKGKSYLNWRYENCGYQILIGEHGGELCGYAITKIEKSAEASVGYIMDIFSIPDKTASLIAGVLKYLMDRDVDYVLCGLLRYDPLCADLKKEGFTERKEYKPIRVTVTPLETGLENRYILDSRSWHLTYGDTDGF